MTDASLPEPTPVPTAAAAAGWYPQAGQHRYWDGSQWTDHFAPAVTAPAVIQVVAAPRAPSNPQATASLVLGIVGVAFGWFPLIGAAVTSPIWILALIFGGLGRAKAKELGSLGRKNATGGIILALVPAAISILAWIFTAVTGGYSN